MTDQLGGFISPRPTAARLAASRIVPTFGGAVLGLAGLVFAIVGGFLLASQGWAHATGTVQKCTSSLVHTSGTNSHWQQNCVMTWAEGGVSHTGTVGVGTTKPYYPGQQLELRVHGDSAAVPSPVWAGYATLGLGIVMMGGGTLLIIRARRAS